MPTLNERPPPPTQTQIRDKKILSRRWSFCVRIFYRNLALLNLCVLLLPFIALLQDKHTTLVENDDNLISAQPQISAHLELAPTLKVQKC